MSEPEKKFGATHVAHNLPSELSPGAVIAVRLTLQNTSSFSWRASTPAGDHVGLAVHWDGVVVANHPLPRPEVTPGEEVTMHFALEAPLVPGRHSLALKLVQYQVAVFEDRGVPALALEVVVREELPTRNAELWARFQRAGPWSYLPTRGIASAATGESYPVFAAQAKGCRIWDLDGREYIDYTMGWGSMLLGYAHEEVNAGIRAYLDTASVVALPQPIQVEVAELLIEDFTFDPANSMACFGKNGSDACSFAARMARLYTGRDVILFSGYHGWQDFWVEQVGFENSGVRPREPQLIHRFPFHDRVSFDALYEKHKHQLAAVMIEPSPWAGNGLGFEPDSDAVFLKHLESCAHAAGGLFVMDEIVTNYRYPGGSVQKAKGVRPDLTCLGKAIASGMPLSAVVGRAEIFKSALPRAFYAATFQAEAYSFAAARAAIGVYRREDVAKHVWDYGVKLREGVHSLCRQLGVAAKFWGMPYRQNFRFEREDPRLHQLERSLFQQELLKEGIFTYNGVMLPSYAHDEAALVRTLEAFGSALEIVARTAQRGDYERMLEIPPLIDL